MNNKLITILKKLFTVYLAIMLSMSSIPYALAQESSPTPPTAPTAPTPPPQPTSSPTAPTAPTPPPQPTSSPTAPTAPTPPPQPTSSPTAPTAPTNPTPTNAVTPSDEGNATGNETSPTNEYGGNVGDTTVVTGDASSEGSILTSGNTNTATSGTSNPSSASNSSSTNNNGATVVNNGNGAQSNNAGNSNAVSNNSTEQQNQARVVNTLNQATSSGDNSNSYNVGSSAISTGNANTTGTIITSVNTNVEGISVAEFNVVDDHVGDFILDFNKGCVSGCGVGSSTATNTNNGANSTNTADSTSINNNTTDQDNLAYIENNLDLSANSGNNEASFNTKGDSTIVTGDANVNANVLTFANNNIAGGNVVFSTVNIFGDLYGDIILTEEAMNAFCGNCTADSVYASNSDNGANSSNESNVSSIDNSNTAQFNNATILNNLVFDANTGGNETAYNTNGDSTVMTGSANIDANVVNVANNNITSEGNMWLVLVNKAGQWFGQLFGSNEDGTMAGSPGMEFAIDDNGEITASNEGNDSGSENTANRTSEDNTTVTQTNDANIVNTINLSANTGDNTSSYNTGGNSTIKTGDANIVANVVNFVNNNIVGTGKLFVTVVNVFGNWVGDFVTPGHEKPESSEGPTNPGNTDSTPVGGPSTNSSNTGSTTQSGSSSIQATTTSVSKVINRNTVRSSIAGTEKETDKVASLDLNPEVAAASIEQNSTSINLAWLVFLIPLYLVITLARKVKWSQVARLFAR